MLCLEEGNPPDRRSRAERQRSDCISRAFSPGYLRHDLRLHRPAAARNQVAPTGRSTTTIRSCPMAQKCSSSIDCAKRLDVYLSFGYSERDAQTATLYNSGCSFPRKNRRSTTASSAPPAPSASSGVMRNAFLSRDGHAMGQDWQSDLLGELHARWRAAALYEKEHYDLHPTPTTIRNGSTPSGTLPLSRTATLSTPICSSAARITPKQAAARTKLPAFRALPAAAAAASLTPSDMTRARPSGMKKDHLRRPRHAEGSCQPHGI